jgi:hypothetical protein
MTSTSAEKPRASNLKLTLLTALPTPKHVLATATRYTPTKRAPLNHITKPQAISWWGNHPGQGYHDCVTAEEAFAKACHNPEIFISDEVAINWAAQHGVLSGAIPSYVLAWMQDDGFCQDGHLYCDGPHQTVQFWDSVILTASIADEPIKIVVGGDQLLATWVYNNEHSGWIATGYHNDQRENHCASLCGYGTIAWLADQLHAQVPAGVDGSALGYAMFTWNSIGIIDHPSMVAITTEAWIRKPTTLIDPPTQRLPR